jgi:hypothetical protein
MASISISIATRSIKNACGVSECFGYAFVASTDEDYHTGDVDSYKEGDDDDDGGYDYAPAA